MNCLNCLRVSLALHPKLIGSEVWFSLPRPHFYLVFDGYTLTYTSNGLEYCHGNFYRFSKRHFAFRLPNFIVRFLLWLKPLCL